MGNQGMSQFHPDYLVMPGEVIEDYLYHLGMTQAELATRTGLTKKTINEIIKGKSPVTPQTALKLERSLGRPAHFWSNLEQQYQEDRIRLMEKQQLESSLEWLKKVPVKAMIKLKWIPKLNDTYNQLNAVLRFFGVASPDQWESVWREYQVVYRQTKKYKTSAHSVSAWLRQGELIAQTLHCNSFDRKAFQKVLDDIRELTTEKPEAFIETLVSICASVGVAVVFVPELPKTGVYGATRWMNDKAVIQLSFRYKSNDHFWFTFFHEAGHVIKHGRKEVFLEGSGLHKEKEKDADKFAMDKLIPPAKLNQFKKRWDGRSLAPIEAFAHEIDIAPGIVVGRLQHDGLLPYQTGNKLKIFFKWNN